MKRDKNRENFQNAKKVIPGGVNSPVRAFKAVGAEPIFIEKAKGPYLYDSDANKYIDYCLSWGPMILGHANKVVLDDVKKVIDKGTSFGIPTKLETELAKMIVEAIDSVEKVRFVSSGTEAVMTAIRLARGCTGRDKIVKFAGCYHGHVDHMLVEAGSGAMTFGSPSSPGVPKDFTKHTIVLPYNDTESVKKAFDKYGDKIAAVIVEPVAGNMGVVLPKTGFLKAIRQHCTEKGSLLIFDEVITGFRVKYGSVQDVFGVEADLTCLGKIIGGGFPIGACCGRAEVMDNLSPEGSVYQAGTLSGNPVCVAAGIATLKSLKSQKPYDALARATEELCKSISQSLEEKNIPHSINRIASMFTLFFNPGPVTDYVSSARSDTRLYARYFTGMLKAGIYLPPSQFEACFISTEHRQKDFDKTIATVRKLVLK
ncbi:MAG: glutamate-1-semialdehyde 2,1-aminomutase [Planctomycetes bacterium]|nr:glutamate-1-semialdehyde 2,1-aminomutase [Planctomycetota bacterium]MBL7106897.1 glutamate-1-semialdehyde 2,1-aminomutase [Phycisphaerae bacterium]